MKEEGFEGFRASGVSWGRTPEGLFLGVEVKGLRCRTSLRPFAIFRV